MITKSYKFDIKSAQPDGTFTGIAAAFGNVDSDNEVILKGAFKESLKQGIHCPVLYMHDRHTPVGWCADARETDAGLEVKAQLMIDTEVGFTAWSFVKTGLDIGGRPGLSVGFIVNPGGSFLKDGTRFFTSISLKEFSIVTFPANSLATAITAKGATPGTEADDDPELKMLREEVGEFDRERKELRRELRESWDLLNKLVNR